MRNWDIGTRTVWSEGMKQVEVLYQEYDQIFQVCVEKTWDLGFCLQKFSELLQRVDHIITRSDLERFVFDYQEVEKRFLEVEKRLEQEKEEKEDTKHEEKESEEIWEKIEEKEEEIEKREKVNSTTISSSKDFSKTAEEVVESIKSHRKNIQSYLAKIDQIKAREITVYRSLIVNKSLNVVGSLIRRGVESKLLSAVVPKQIAQTYLAVMLLQDTSRIIKKDDMVITRFEVDTSYYDELLHDQANIKNYRGLVQESLIELKKLKSVYQNVCCNFPEEVIYQENLKKLDDLENTLLEESLEIETVVDEYDSAMNYNEQRIKSLKG